MSLNISQGLTWIKTLKSRHEELVTLRNENSASTRRLFGENKEIEKTPVYSIQALDAKICGVAREIRNLDELIKETNASTQIVGYEKDEGVLDIDFGVIA